MIHWFINLLYGGLPAEFESAFSLEESVQRLATATERSRSVFSSITREVAVGTVREDRVSLERAIPFVGNSFKPLFTGRFHRLDGRVILSGQFTMPLWVKVFMTFWFGFWLVAILLSLAHDPRTWWAPFAEIGMFAAGAAFVWFCKWISRTDIPWLSVVVHNALSREPPNNRLQRDAPQATRA
jgi:hypothetical protein